MDENKKEPKYLDLSAHAEVNLEELLERLMPPKHPKPSETPDKEAKENDGNN
jgi:hypothetical protein